MLPADKGIKALFMTASVHPPEHWTPTSAEDRELVEKELDSILASYHFRGSKRYPAMLKYVVGAALEGHADDLKERTLGVEVFGRYPDYDTSADPVVRFIASEVRKRIAQYYHENGNGSSLQIELPLGSYVPEFIPRPPVPSGNGLGTASSPPEPVSDHSARKLRSLQIAPATFGALGALILCAVVFAALWYHKSPDENSSAVNKLWRPLLTSRGQVLFVVGPVLQEALMARAENTGAIDNGTGRYDHVSVLSAVALTHLAGVLQKSGRSYEVKESTETSLADMRSRPVVLIGAVNNTWTMHMVNPLRFRFLFDGRKAEIEDTGGHHNPPWSFDVTDSSQSVTTDYALVARFHDPTTEGPMLVIAGLGPNGTEVASEFASDPQYIGRIAEKMPVGWENKNVELVLKMDVIGSKAGPPELVSSTVW
jgi:hypothetical protein